jgi:hypothetical protein
VLHILGLARKFSPFNKMSDVGVHTLFHKDARNMVIGVMVLMKGVWILILYKLLRNFDLNECNNIIIPEVDLTST